MICHLNGLLDKTPFLSSSFRSSKKNYFVVSTPDNSDIYKQIYINVKASKAIF